MDYVGTSQSTLDALLGELRHHLVPTGVFAIRTHYRTTSDDASRRHLVLHFPNQPERHLILSPRPGQRIAALNRLVKYTGFDPELANRILDLGHELSELNDLGGWSLMDPPRKASPLTMDAHQVAGMQYNRYAAFAELYDSIAEKIEDRVGHIELLNYKPNQPTMRGVRWSAWQYFYDREGNQIAAHQQHVMNLLISQFVGRDEKAQESADYTLRGLGKQLHLPPEGVVLLNMMISSAQQRFDINRIELAS